MENMFGPTWCAKKHIGARPLRRMLRNTSKHYKDIKLLRYGNFKVLPMYEKCNYRGGKFRKQLANGKDIKGCRCDILFNNLG